MKIKGLSQQDLELLYKLVITPLKDLGAKVWIFGSRATGAHAKFSDVDILFSLDSNSTRAAISKIKEDIEESRFPYKVDLVSEADLADAYKPNVHSQRVEL